MHTQLYENWVGGRQLSAVGSNAGAEPLPFQKWQHFKEAFAPEFIAQSVAKFGHPVRHCLDPFGGSGTTPLTCQFLGIKPTAIEVNPYLADLIEAKLCTYNLDRLAKDVGKVVQMASDVSIDASTFFQFGPATLVEPGDKGRWIFDLPVAEAIGSLLAAINQVKDKKNRRLLKVLLGGRLVDLSNIRVNGKGRRYRGDWQNRAISPRQVIDSFIEAVGFAVHDLTAHQDRLESSWTVLRGDSRALISKVEPFDLAIFSPPYPNSFDYTDVYNVELWMLGYLREKTDNASLRRSTFCSHVQLSREYPLPPNSSKMLNRTLGKLIKKKEQLWHRDIVAMVGGYFADTCQLLSGMLPKLAQDGQVHIVVGDSQYAGVPVPVASIIQELSGECGYEVLEKESIRAMRASAQQGGNPNLPETRLVLAKA